MLLSLYDVVYQEDVVIPDPETGDFIVEDGTSKTNSMTYSDLAFARSFGSSIGLTLPDDDADLQAALLAAMGYIESQTYQGYPTSAAQALQWPRKNVLINEYPFPSDAIPLMLKKAQVVAASMVLSGIELFPTVDGQFVTREKVGPVETEYSSEYLATLNGMPLFSAIDVYLKPLMNWRSGYKLSPSFGF